MIAACKGRFPEIDRNRQKPNYFNDSPSGTDIASPAYGNLCATKQMQGLGEQWRYAYGENDLTSGVTIG